MITAILIDDEQSSLNALNQKIQQHCENVKIIALCNDSFKGKDAIETLHPDLVFLDIEMPLMNGFTLLQNIQHKNFELIFVTAYDHYAIKAIRYSALDYLMKPVEIDDLKIAVARAFEKINTAKPNARLELLLENILNEKTKFRRIAITTTQGLQFIKTDEIIYLEASGNYTKFYLGNNIKYTVSKTLKEFEDILPSDVFIRIHNSDMVSKNYVEKYIRGEGGQVVLSNGSVLDISKRKKAEFLKAIGY